MIRSDQVMTNNPHRPLRPAGVTGVHLVPSPDEEVPGGGVAGPPVAALQELGLELRSNISYAERIVPPPR